MQYAVVRFETCNTILRMLSKGSTPQDVASHVQRLHEVAEIISDAAHSRYAAYRSVREALGKAAKDINHLLSLCDEAIHTNDARDLQFWVEEIKRVPLVPELRSERAAREARYASYQQATRPSHDHHDQD